MQGSGLINPGNAATSGPNLSQIGSRQQDGTLQYRVGVGGFGHTAGYDGRFCGRPAHVIGNHVLVTNESSQLGSADGARRRARFHHGDGHIPGHGGCHDAAVGLHDLEDVFVATLGKFFLQVTQIVSNHGHDVGVLDRRARPLIFVVTPGDQMR